MQNDASEAKRHRASHRIVQNCCVHMQSLWGNWNSEHKRKQNYNSETNKRHQHASESARVCVCVCWQATCTLHRPRASARCKWENDGHNLSMFVFAINIFVSVRKQRWPTLFSSVITCIVRPSVRSSVGRNRYGVMSLITVDVRYICICISRASLPRWKSLEVTVSRRLRKNYYRLVLLLLIVVKMIQSIKLEE